MTTRPRILVIRALEQSPGPAAAAMAAVWPAAVCNNLIDDSLARDLEEHGEYTPEIEERILALGRCAANAKGADGATAGVMFTCSAFGAAIRRVKAELSIPVVSPNEGAFEKALDVCKMIKDGGRVGLLVSFARSLDPLSKELLSMAAARKQRPPKVVTAIADGALDTLRAGDEFCMVRAGALD